MRNIFISHNASDHKLLLQLETALLSSSNGDLNIWDSENLPIGSNWVNEIERRLKYSDAYLMLITENYLSSLNAVYEMGVIAQIHKFRNAPAIPIFQRPVESSRTPVANLLGFTISETKDVKLSEELNSYAPRIIEAIRLSQYRNFPLDSGEIYLSYRALEPGVFSGIMDSINLIYYTVYGISCKRFIGEPIRALREVNEQNRLLLQTVETGQSITFKVKTGWAPSITMVNSDIAIELPKGAISLVATFSLLMTGIEGGISMYSDVLDIVKKQNEIQMQSLQQQKMALEVEKLLKELKEAPTSVKKEIDNNIQRFSKLTLGNRDINAIRLRTHQQQLEAHTENNKWLFRED